MYNCEQCKHFTVWLITTVVDARNNNNNEEKKKRFVIPSRTVPIAIITSVVAAAGVAVDDNKKKKNIKNCAYFYTAGRVVKNRNANIPCRAHTHVQFRIYPKGTLRFKHLGAL